MDSFAGGQTAGRSCYNCGSFPYNLRKGDSFASFLKFDSVHFSQLQYMVAWISHELWTFREGLYDWCCHFVATFQGRDANCLQLGGDTGHQVQNLGITDGNIRTIFSANIFAGPWLSNARRRKVVCLNHKLLGDYEYWHLDSYNCGGKFYLNLVSATNADRISLFRRRTF